MTTVSFTDDQILAILEYLEQQRAAGYQLEDVIQGLEDGTITRSTFTNQSV